MSFPQCDEVSIQSVEVEVLEHITYQVFVVITFQHTEQEEDRNEGRKEGRKGGREEGREEGKKEGHKE